MAAQWRRAQEGPNAAKLAEITKQAADNADKLK